MESRTSSEMTQTNEEANKSLDSTFESIIIDIPKNLTFSSASSSSYDTDSSVNSATCCTKHIEHNYMQKPLTQPLPGKQQDHRQIVSDIKSAAKIDIEDVYFKADHRKSFPIFIMLISLLEVSCGESSLCFGVKLIFYLFVFILDRSLYLRQH